MNLNYTTISATKNDIIKKIGFDIFKNPDDIKNIGRKPQVDPDEEVGEDVRKIYPISRNYSRDKNKKKVKIVKIKISLKKVGAPLSKFRHKKYFSFE